MSWWWWEWVSVGIPGCDCLEAVRHTSCSTIQYVTVCSHEATCIGMYSTSPVIYTQISSAPISKNYRRQETNLEIILKLQYKFHLDKNNVSEQLLLLTSYVITRSVSKSLKQKISQSLKRMAMVIFNQTFQSSAVINGYSFNWLNKSSVKYKSYCLIIIQWKFLTHKTEIFITTVKRPTK